MKMNMKVTVAIALTAVLTAGFVSTAQADIVGLIITEAFAPDGTPTASAHLWTSPNPLTVTRDLSRTDGRVWLIDLTGSGHQLDGIPQIETWNDINSPGRWNNLYWDDPMHLHLESEWPIATGWNMAGYPNGFDNGVSWWFGRDFNGDDVCAVVNKIPVIVDPCAAGLFNAYAMQNWSSTGIAEGTTTITPSSGPATSATFSYNVILGGGGVSSRTATFKTTAVGSRIFSFGYDYTGFHAWFRAEANLQVFADGPAGTEVITLVHGPVDAPFAFTGSASIQTHHGFPFGFIVGGGNFDSISQVLGDLKIFNIFNPDADDDFVADSCDVCPGHDDKADVDFDHIPDACDQCSLVGDINCDGAVNLEDLALMAGNWLAHN